MKLTNDVTIYERRIGFPPENYPLLRSGKDPFQLYSPLKKKGRGLSALEGIIFQGNIALFLESLGLDVVGFEAGRAYDLKVTHSSWSGREITIETKVLNRGDYKLNLHPGAVCEILGSDRIKPKRNSLETPCYSMEEIKGSIRGLKEGRTTEADLCIFLTHRGIDESGYTNPLLLFVPTERLIYTRLEKTNNKFNPTKGKMSFYIPISEDAEGRVKLYPRTKNENYEYEPAQFREDQILESLAGLFDLMSNPDQPLDINDPIKRELIMKLWRHNPAFRPTPNLAI